MQISEIFNSTDKDNAKVLKTALRSITFAEIKSYVKHRRTLFAQNPCNKIVLLGSDAFEFIINFWAGIFANKEIYVLSDEKRLQSLNFEYILPDKITEKQEKTEEFIEPKETKIILYTSGSTGAPKKIIKNLDVILTEGMAIIDEFSELFEDNSTFYTTSNCGHMYILTMFLIVPFLKSFCIDTRKIEFPEQLDELTQKPYVLITSPTFLEALKKYNTTLKQNPYLIFSAGNNLSLETQKYFEEQNSKLINIYGASEAGVIGYKLNSDEVYMQKFALVEISEERGLLLVKTPFAIEDKILTSDITEIFAQGKFLVKGRSDRLVKISDKRVSLIELEERLTESDLVEDVYCFEYEGKLCSVIVLTDLGKKFCLKEGSFKLKSTLKNFLRNSSEVIPSRFKFLYSIPKDERGKISTKKLKEVFGTNISQPIIMNIDKTEQECNLELFFPKSSNFLKGHFAVFPIVPGVVQLQFAHDYAQNFFNENLPVWQVKRIKFTNVITPDKIITLKLKNGENSVNFQYINENGENYSSGSFAKLKGDI